MVLAERARSRARRASTRRARSRTSSPRARACRRCAAREEAPLRSEAPPRARALRGGPLTDGRRRTRARGRGGLVGARAHGRRPLRRRRWRRRRPPRAVTRGPAALAALLVRALRRHAGDVELVLAALHAEVLLARPLDGAEGVVVREPRDAPPPALAPMLDPCAERGPGTSAAAAARPRRRLRGARRPRPPPPPRAAPTRRARHRCCCRRIRARPRARAGGVAVLLAVMHRHRAVADVRTMACWALAAFSLNPAQRALTLRARGKARSRTRCARTRTRSRCNTARELRPHQPARARRADRRPSARPPTPRRPPVLPAAATAAAARRQPRLRARRRDDGRRDIRAAAAAAYGGSARPDARAAAPARFRRHSRGPLPPPALSDDAATASARPPSRLGRRRAALGRRARRRPAAPRLALPVAPSVTHAEVLALVVQAMERFAPARGARQPRLPRDQQPLAPRRLGSLLAASVLRVTPKILRWHAARVRGERLAQCRWMGVQQQCVRRCVESARGDFDKRRLEARQPSKKAYAGIVGLADASSTWRPCMQKN